MMKIDEDYEAARIVMRKVIEDEMAKNISKPKIVSPVSGSSRKLDEGYEAAKIVMGKVIEVQIAFNIQKSQKEEINLDPEQLRESDGLDNRGIVENAQKAFDIGNWAECILLFEKSIIICKRQCWQDGINYAYWMIDRCNNKK